jgi:hypothetical protein
MCRDEPSQDSYALTYQLLIPVVWFKNVDILNNLFDTMELLRNSSNRWCWDEMCVEFLLKEFSR